MLLNEKAGLISSFYTGAHRFCSLELVIFTILSVLNLAPIWSFRYLPTQDGPSHLANALMLKDYHRPGTRYQGAV